MKRFRLSAKLAMAIIPIGLVAVAAAGFIAYSFLQDSIEQNETAHAATVTADAVNLVTAVWNEEGNARDVYLFEDQSATDDLQTARSATDEALDQLEGSVRDLELAASGFFGSVSSSASEDVAAIGAQLQVVRGPQSPSAEELEQYQALADSILAVLPRANSIVADRVQSRDLSTAYYLAEGGQVSLQEEQLIEEFRVFAGADPSTTDTFDARTNLQSTLVVLEDEFGAWARRANQTANQMSAAILRYTRLPDVNIDTFPLARNENILNTSETMAERVAEESQASAVESERQAYLVAGVAAIVLLLAVWGSYAVIRSVVRRVRGLTSAAVKVSEEDLPNLVAALQNPREDISELQPATIEAAGRDEVGDLASSFTMLHSTLIDVASQQMEILRKGVSDIFVTLARRNRSLVDRQLALLDELESQQEDAETLGGYYKLDHLATRMRRNAESLLVLAGSEPTRIWSEPLDVSEIIRAALGEVDDYQRVDIMALEPAQISGRAVADIAHLMSELLDNGTQFSSPADRVRVAGLFDPDGYMLTVSDNGIGMTGERIAEMNHLLQSPPVLGLALQPTLGMYVVARLAARYGVTVQIVSGSPGITVRVLLPKSLIEVAAPRPAPQPVREQFPDEPVAPPAESVAANGASKADSAPVVTGSVKGKHEHPKKPTASELEMGVKSDHFAPADDEHDATADELLPEEEGPLELAQRVPGETLRAEEEKTELDYESGHDDYETVDTEQDYEPVDTEQDYEPVEPVEEFEPVEALETSEIPSAFTLVEDGGADDEPWWSKEIEPQREETPEPSLWSDDEKNEMELAEAAAEAAEAAPRLSDAGLPMRQPGTSFKEVGTGEASSAPSDSGAIGIRSALSSFAGGRSMAGGGTEESPDSDDEGRDE